MNITVDGITKSQNAWARSLSISHTSITAAVKRGVPADEYIKIVMKKERKHTRMNMDIANAIRAEYFAPNSDVTQKALAEKYNTTDGCISRIISFKSWNPNHKRRSWYTDPYDI